MGNRQINLKAVLAKYELDPVVIAPKMFPLNKHAWRALERYIEGGIALREPQLTALCEITGATFEELKAV